MNSALRMNLNVRSQNSYFPLTSLPVDVLYHIAQYLTTRDLRSMTKVDRCLRDLFNSPHFWKDVRVRLPDRKIDPQSVEILRVREIRDLEIFNLNFELETIVLQPYLERLSLRDTTVKTLEALTKAASEGHLKLRSLAFGCIDCEIEFQSKVTFLDLFKSLPMLEEVCFGHFEYFMSYTDNITTARLTNVVIDPMLEKPMEVDLKQALCCTGKLTSISLKCFSEVGKSWLKTVVLKNPHLQTLCLADVKHFTSDTSEGLDDEANPTVCSNLTTFKLLIKRALHREYRRTAKQIILSWAFPGNGAYENLTSLDMTGCHTTTFIRLHPNFPGLKKLNLTDSYLATASGTERELLRKSWAHFPSLEWLQLKGCRMNLHVLTSIFERTGKTLCYLGLPEHHRLTDNVLRDLPMLFPVLKTLDLSGCKRITDAILVEWYLKHNQSEWPKLRKLVMKGCEGVSQVVVDTVRMKTRNQLLIEL